MESQLTLEPLIEDKEKVAGSFEGLLSDFDSFGFDKRLTPNHFDELWEKLDADSKGYLHKEESFQFMKGIYKAMGKQVPSHEHMDRLIAH